MNKACGCSKSRCPPASSDGARAGAMYRTVRWGKDLEVWLVEGRDFRSPNNMPDGPDKSIWGGEQKEWLKKTLLASDATFKILVSPTPIVGPDRGNKADNHANSRVRSRGQRVPTVGGGEPAEELHDLLRRPALAVPLGRSGHGCAGVLLRTGQR